MSDISTPVWWKPKGETRLERAVARWLNDKGADYDTGAAGAYKDLAYGGCASGMVGELIYYADTVKFYRRHKKEIHALLKEMIESTGVDGPGALFGDKWDKEDPLADEQFNQNLLAWFAFEETARKLADAAGIEA